MQKLQINSAKKNAKEAYDQLRTHYDVVSNQPGIARVSRKLTKAQMIRSVTMKATQSVLGMQKAPRQR